MSPTYWFQKIYIQMFFWEKIINLGVPKQSNLHWKNVKNSWRVPIWIPNGPNGFYCYYKLGKLFLLQIWATLITNWSRVVTNWDRFVINRSSYYKSEEILQIGAQQTCSIERIHKNRYTGIPGLWAQELDARLWTLDAGRWTLDTGRWTVDAGLWTLLWLHKQPYKNT